MCVGVLLGGKGHEDLPSGLSKGNKEKECFEDPSQGRKKKTRPAGEQKGGMPQLLRRQTYEYKLFVFKMSGGKTTFFFSLI